MDITRRDTVRYGMAGGALLSDAASAAGGSKSMALTSEQAKLLDAAFAVRQKAYAPYSKFLVGAALLTEDGTVFLGCNVENASYGATNCAERSALFAAVSNGRRKFKMLAVVGDLPTPITPCGICRQVLAEFGKDTVVVCSNLKRETWVTTVATLLPGAFALDDKHKA